MFVRPSVRLFLLRAALLVCFAGWASLTVTSSAAFVVGRVVGFVHLIPGYGLRLVAVLLRALTLEIADRIQAVMFPPVPEASLERPALEPRNKLDPPLALLGDDDR